MDQLTGLSTVVAFLAGLSVATERVTEFVKNIPAISSFLSKPQPKGIREDLRVNAVHTLAAVVGAVLCSQMPPDFISGLNPHLPKTWALYAFFGVLASGGAGFWNSALDTLRAVKKTKQDLQAAGASLAATLPPPSPVPVATATPTTTAKAPVAAPLPTASDLAQVSGKEAAGPGTRFRDSTLLSSRSDTDTASASAPVAASVPV